MRVTISGKPGAGKSVLARKLCSEFNLKYHSIGAMLRRMAEEKEITMVEAGELAERDPEYDKMFDNEIKRISEDEDDFVIDGRLGFYFAPNTFKIFLDVSDEEGGRRIFEAGREDERFSELKDAVENVRERFSNARERYKKHYGVDIGDLSNYDLMVDTTEMAEQEVFRFVKERLRSV